MSETSLPEELESAVYEVVLEPTDDVQTAVNALCDANPDHADAIRHLVRRVHAGARVTGSEALSGESVRPTIGGYELHDEIGRGGFGVVYRATQSEPLRRSVALKVLAPGLNAGSVHARFETERQLLARLQHPNIAKVYDAGTTAEGRPWFAMELIDGPPITQWCAARRPDIIGTLELFLTACDAVQHAHQRGVIHRDLKPGNVLVELVDEVPTARVIDFGVAKALQGDDGGRLDEATLAGAVIGTPEYMSPEQARGDEADVRSDVFGLGALLYRLLTDAPIRELQTGGSTWQELTSVDPARPSRRAVTSAPDRVGQLKGDLDWICLTALRRDPNERYASVAELASDLRLHLEGRPVTARPPSFGYLMATTWRRHRSRLIALAAGVLLLATATVVSTLLWLEARQQEELASQRAGELDRAYGELQRVTDPLRAADRVAHADEQLWPALPRMIPAFEQWLGDVTPLVERIAATMPDDADGVALRERVSQVRNRLASARRLEERRGRDASAWSRALQELGDDQRFDGLELEPIAGLVPLGADPDSGLQEFAHLLTGTAAERGPDGRLQPRESDGLVLVLIPGGTAVIGAQIDDPTQPRFDASSSDNERPVHSVALDPCLVSKWEVTQAQWMRIADGGDNPSRWHDRMQIRGTRHSLQHPVEQVSWLDATTAMRKVGLALPTEVLWEYLARGGANGPWLGVTDAAELVRRENIADSSYRAAAVAGAAAEAAEDGFVFHAPVGSFEPNGYGLCDVLGNVGEWTSSGFHDYSVVATARTGERTATEVSRSRRNHRVFRGGSWDLAMRLVRVSRRSSAPVDARSASIGVRPVHWLSIESADEGR